MFYLGFKHAELSECEGQIELQHMQYLSCVVYHCCFYPTKFDKLIFGDLLSFLSFGGVLHELVLPRWGSGQHVLLQEKRIMCIVIISHGMF